MKTKQSKVAMVTSPSCGTAAAIAKRFASDGLAVSVNNSGMMRQGLVPVAVTDAASFFGERRRPPSVARPGDQQEGAGRYSQHDEQK